MRLSLRFTAALTLLRTARLRGVACLIHMYLIPDHVASSSVGAFRHC
jgi:hypothetical protein